MTDQSRYVFAKLDVTGWYASDVTDIPAPSPEDWQAIVEAVAKWEAATLGYAEGVAHYNLANRAIAAVRNMREAEG